LGLDYEKNGLEITEIGKRNSQLILNIGDYIMNILVEIWKDKLSDYVIMDYIAKIWITGLLLLFVVGFATLMYGIISGEADIQNATFGVFDYCC
jgi:hypothetical protein